MDYFNIISITIKGRISKLEGRSKEIIQHEAQSTKRWNIQKKSKDIEDKIKRTNIHLTGTRKEETEWKRGHIHAGNSQELHRLEERY